MARSNPSERHYPCWVVCIGALALVLCFPALICIVACGAETPWCAYFVTAGLSTYGLSVLAGRKDRSDAWLRAIAESVGSRLGSPRAH